MNWWQTCGVITTVVVVTLSLVIIAQVLLASRRAFRKESR